VIESERSGSSIPLKIIRKKNDPKGYRIVAAQRIKDCCRASKRLQRTGISVSLIDNLPHDEVCVPAAEGQR